MGISVLNEGDKPQSALSVGWSRHCDSILDGELFSQRKDNQMAISPGLAFRNLQELDKEIWSLRCPTDLWIGVVLFVAGIFMPAVACVLSGLLLRVFGGSGHHGLLFWAGVLAPMAMGIFMGGLLMKVGCKSTHYAYRLLRWRMRLVLNPFFYLDLLVKATDREHNRILGAQHRLDCLAKAAVREQDRILILQHMYTTEEQNMMLDCERAANYIINERRSLLCGDRPRPIANDTRLDDSLFACRGFMMSYRGGLLRLRLRSMKRRLLLFLRLD